MPLILAGRVQLQEHALDIVEELKLAGCPAEKITSFYVCPPGQHGTYPIGGDRYKSPESGDDSASIITQVIETVMGTEETKSDSDEVLNQRDDDGEVPVTNTGESEQQNEQQNEQLNISPDAVPVRKAGMLVALEVEDPNRQSQIVDQLKRLGAHDIEVMNGEIVNGEWQDFDVLSMPRYVDMNQASDTA